MSNATAMQALFRLPHPTGNGPTRTRTGAPESAIDGQWVQKVSLDRPVDRRAASRNILRKTVSFVRRARVWLRVPKRASALSVSIGGIFGVTIARVSLAATGPAETTVPTRARSRSLGIERHPVQMCRRLVSKCLWHRATNPLWKRTAGVATLAVRRSAVDPHRRRSEPGIVEAGLD